MKKILLISRCAWTLYNFRLGLMRELVDQGYMVCAGGAEEKVYSRRLEKMGIPFKALPVDKKGINPLQDFRLIGTLIKWYLREKPDVVHHFTIKPVIYGSIAANIARVPKIVNTVTGLGYVFNKDSSIWLRLSVEFLYSIALRLADFTFFQNKEDMSLFIRRKLISPGKAESVPGSGVDCLQFSPSASGRRIQADDCTFLMVSRLIKEKGVYDYVEAAKLVKSKYPGCRFQIIGRRDTRNPNVVPESDIQSWSESGLVQWLGEVIDVRPIVENADIVVLPSYYQEGTPRSLLEAAALEKAIITTESVGCRDAVDDGVTGMTVPVKDPIALANAMMNMIRDPEKTNRMGRRGRQKMKQEFDERIVIQRSVKQYL